MIKLFGLGCRKKGMPREEFHDHWRHPHGTWGRTMTTLRGYVQSHQVDTEFLGPSQTDREMVAEMWLDRLEDVENFRTEPVLVKYLKSDEPNFLESNGIFFAAREEVLPLTPPAGGKRDPGDDQYELSTRPFSIKLLHFVGSDVGGSWSRDDDVSHAFRLGALRYVRCHALQLGEAAPAFRGAHELWWPTMCAFRRGVAQAPDAFKALIAPSSAASVTLVAQAERLL